MATLVAVDGDPFSAPQGPKLVPVDGNPFDKKAVAKEEPSAPQRSTASELARQVGLTGRAAIKGIAGTVGVFSDPIAYLLQKTTGQTVPPAAEMGDRLSNALGLPQPENATERVVQDVAGAMTGAGATAKGAQVLTQGGSEIARQVGQQMGRNVGTQLAAAGASGGAAGAVRENGGGPAAQIAAALGAGLAAPVAVSAAAAVPRTAKALIEPFTEAGKQKIVGSAITRIASDPKNALSGLNNAEEIVPGSIQTSAQAARDPGLLTLERSLASQNPLFAERQVQNNAARNALLEGYAKDDAALNAAKGARLSSGNELYGEAFAQASQEPSAALKGLMERPAFQKAVEQAKTIAANQGEPMANPLTTVRGLHYVKLALDDMLEPTATNALARNAKSALVDTKNKLVSEIENISPKYAEARQSYAEASKPINQMELMQDIAQRSKLAGSDVAGNPVLSQAKFSRALQTYADEIGKTLTPEQTTALQKVAKDLDVAQLSQSAGRAAGSNTYQNMTTANVLGAMLKGNVQSNAVADTLMRPLAFVYKLPEKDAQDLLVRAMLDPKVASQLMQKATPENVSKLSSLLAEKARALSLGAVAGSEQQRQPIEQ